MTIAKEIVWAAIEFGRTVRRHSDISDEQVEQMFDAFDPSLKRHILISALNPNYTLRIADPYRQGTSKINAIKEVRAAFGWGLKEAKEFVELAETRDGALIPLDQPAAAVEKLSQALLPTGYRIC